MRSWLIAALAGLSIAAQGQSPDVAVFAELRPTWTIRTGSQNVYAWNDPYARHSLVGFRLILESGHRVYVGQRLQRIESSGDPDSVEEYYVESRGNWRIGKQFLPFGQRRLMREAVLAARLDSELFFDALPLSVAACDGGSGRTRAVFVRLGGVAGVSVAAGDHIGIQQTSFTALQSPESATGVGRGHRLALGADGGVSVGSVFFEGEWVSLRQGETPRDGDRDLSDLRLRFRTPGTRYMVEAGWARDWSSRDDTYRLQIELPTPEKVTFVAGIRTDALSFRDFFLSTVIRL